MSDPAESAEAVTTGDTAASNFTRAARALYIGTTGNVAVVLKTGTAVTFVGAPAGLILPVECVRVNSTNTTASNIVALR